MDYSACYIIMIILYSQEVHVKCLVGHELISHQSSLTFLHCRRWLTARAMTAQTRRRPAWRPTPGARPGSGGPGARSSWTGDHLSGDPGPVTGQLRIYTGARKYIDKWSALTSVWAKWPIVSPLENERVTM